MKTHTKKCKWGKFILLRHDFISNAASVYGEWSECELDLFRLFLRPGDVVVEVGSHIGLHTVPLAKMVGPAGKVYAFEPQRILQEIAAGNVVLNNLNNVTVERKAVGKVSGHIRVPVDDYTSIKNYGAIKVNDPSNDSLEKGKWEEVGCVSLDDYFRISSSSKEDVDTTTNIKLLKVDVEGMESDVLEGASRLIQIYQPMIFVEVNDQDVIDWLLNHEYKCFWYCHQGFHEFNYNGVTRDIFNRLGDINIIAFPPKTNNTGTLNLTKVTSYSDIRKGKVNWVPSVIRERGIQTLTRTYRNEPVSHANLVQVLENIVSYSFLLKNHRTYVCENKLGYGEPCFHGMWDVLVDEMPSEFNFLEIGVFKGQITSLIRLIANYKKKACQVVGVTPLDVHAPDTYANFTRPDKLKEDDLIRGLTQLYEHYDLDVHKDLKLIQGYSYDEHVKEQVRLLAPYDMIFIDGGHDYRTILNDIKLCAPLIKQGGYLVIDDSANHLNTGFSFKGYPDVSRCVDELLPPLGWNASFKHLFNAVHDRVWQKIKPKVHFHRRVLLVDPSGWDYTPDTPYNYPLGGTQSAMLYLACALVDRGKEGNSTPYEIRLLNGSKRKSCTRGIMTEPYTGIEGTLEQIEEWDPDFTLVINDPLVASILGKAVRNKVYCLNQHDINQPAIQCMKNFTTIAGIDQMIFVSHWQKREYQKAFGWPENRSIVLKNAMAPSFQLLPRPYLEHKELALVYTSTPFRGLDRLVLTIFPNLRKTYPELKLHVFSSMKVYQVDDKDDVYHNLYLACKVTDGIEYHGSVSQTELAKYVHQSLIFAYPNTFRETSCISAIEAMAAGCFVVCSRLGALEETTAGFASLVDPGDDASFEAEIRRIIDRYLERDESLEQHLQNQVKWIKGYYTWKRRASEFHHHVRGDHDIQLALSLRETNQVNEAKSVVQKIVANHYPNQDQALFLAGEMYGDPKGENFLNAIRLNPYDQRYYDAYGLCLSGKNARTDNDLQKALEAYCKCIHVFDGNVPAQLYFNLSDLYFRLNRASTPEACRLFSDIITRFPTRLYGYMCRSLMTPKVCDSENHERNVVTKYWKQLQALSKKECNVPSHQDRDDVILLNMYPYTFKPYRYIPDLSIRMMAETLAEFYTKHINLPYPSTTSSSSLSSFPVPEEGRKIRVGFAFGNLYCHSSTNLLRGLVKALPRNKYTVFIYNLGPSRIEDVITRDLRECSEEAYTCEKMNTVELAIRLNKLDVLVYSEIGMNLTVYKAALMRLAPVQVVHAWGHPVTSGMKTIDYVVSMKHGEVENAQSNYTEKLYCLDGLSSYYSRPTIRDPSCIETEAERFGLDTRGFVDVTYTRADYDLPENAHIYTCIQSLWKFNPEFMVTVRRILEKDPQGIFVMIDKDFGIKRFKEGDDRVIHLPTLKHAKLLGLIQVSDVILDTFPWSGGVTSLETFAMNKPVITLVDDRYLFGRLTYAMYQEMDIQECIASSLDEYVDLAVRMGTDLTWRTNITLLIKDRSERLFESEKCLREWDIFFHRVTGIQTPESK